jgi:RNA polymerase sigma-70 factor (ECF subfamily)
MADRSEHTDLLLACDTQEERQKLMADLFMRQRDRLKLMVSLRLSDQLRGRVDPSDVVQEAYIEVMQRLDSYIKNRPMPLFAWFRRITGKKLIECFRQHIGAKGRDIRRERNRYLKPVPHTTAVGLVDHLATRGPSPSQAAFQAERRSAILEALERMDPLDRDVLVLRHFESLSNSEIACELGIEPSAASKRYHRALRKFKRILTAGSPGAQEGWL